MVACRILMRIPNTLGLAICLVLGIIACSTESPTNSTLTPDISAREGALYSARTCWGVWDVTINRTDSSVEVVPLRGASFQANVTKFLQPPSAPTNLLTFSIMPGTDFSTGKVNCDVSVKHPFPGTMFAGFDVMGIVMDDWQPESSEADSDITYSLPPSTLLRNADGWTRWWNQVEFTTTGKIFGYTEGAKASYAFESTHTLNAFKYFCDDLGSEDQFNPDPSKRGFFSSDTPGINTRRFELQFFDDGAVEFHLKYAISASWVAPTGGASAPYTADEYPIEANMPEAYWIGIIDNGSTAFYQSMSVSGGDLNLLLEIRDWQFGGDPSTVVDEVASVTVESPTLLAFPIDLDLSKAQSVPGNSTARRIPVSIPNVTPKSLENEILLFIVKSAHPTTYEPQIPGITGFDFPDGALAAYQIAYAPIKGIGPQNDPPVADASASKPLDGNAPLTVDLDPSLSVDSDGTIVLYEWDFESDGTYDVSCPTPEVIQHAYAEGTYNVTLRVTDDDGAKDTDQIVVFSNQPPEPFIQVLVPNGGEEWACGSSQEITWTSFGVAGSVSIFFSEDNFESDIHAITGDTPNDGSFIWEPVLSEPSTSLRIKISSNDAPSIHDVSDDDFNLVESGWALTWGGQYMDGSHESAVDSNGYVYLTGFESKTGIELLAFLRKFNAAGQLMWGKSWGGDGASTVGKGIAVDGSGCIYVGGQFAGSSVDFDPGPAQDLHSAGGAFDACLSKFDSSGTYMWGRSWGGTDSNCDVTAFVLSVNEPWGVFVSGFFSGINVDFDPDAIGTELHDSMGKNDAFLSRFDTAGGHLWTDSWGGSSEEFVSEVSSDNQGRPLVTGFFYSTPADFDPDPVGVRYIASNGSHDAFLSWFDNTGDLLGVYTWGGDALDWAYSVDIDSSGNVYVGGGFCSDSVDFDPGDGTDEHSNASGYEGYENASLSKFDSSLNYQWVKTMGSVEADTLYWSIDVDNLDNIFIAGDFTGYNVDFDPGIGTDFRSSNGNGNYNSFWTKFDPEGNYVTTQTWGGTADDMAWGGISVSNSGRIYVSGYMGSSTVEFAPIGAPCFDSSDIHSNNGDVDAFLVKYMPDGCW